MVFEPTSAAEQFVFSISFAIVAFVLLCIGRLILYWIRGEEDDD